MQFIIQKKSLILSVIFFLTCCFVFVFLYKSLNDSEKMLLLAQEKWQIEASRIENVKYLADLIKEIEPEKALLEKHFVKSSDVVPFLDTIEKLAQKAEVKAEVLAVNVADDASFLVVEIKTLGSFEAIYKLILLLENSSYELEFVFANIQNMSAQELSATKNSKTQQWTATFQIKLLSFIN